jgi:type VI secretion system protein VasD
VHAESGHTDKQDVGSQQADRQALALAGRRRVLGLLASPWPLLLASCAKPAGPPPPPPPGKLNLRIRASDTVNPSVSGRPSPLMLRIYELKSDTAFAGSDFLTLFQNDRGALGADLVKRDELTLRPGEERVVDRLLDVETRQLAFLAAYRDLERAQWRLVRPVRPSTLHQWNLVADERSLRLSGTP